MGLAALERGGRGQAMGWVITSTVLDRKGLGKTESKCYEKVNFTFEATMREED